MSVIAFHRVTDEDYQKITGAAGADFAPSMEVQFDSQGGANMQTSQAQIDEWITRVKAWV